MAYIYKITNDLNQKIYIGKTERTIEERFKEHCKDYTRRECENRPLYRAMKKYGVEHFHIELLEETDKPEEREIYWIEKLKSFGHNGYNATLGGDGKKYIDYDLVIATYKEVQEIQKTAELLNISVDSVSNILHQAKVDILTTQQVLTNKYGKITNMYDLDGNFLRSFASTNEAARYMVENDLTGCKHTTIKQHITEVCTGRRKTAAKFKWIYTE